MYTTDSSCNPVGSKPCPFCSVCFLFLLVNHWNGTLALMKKAYYESSHEQHTRKAQKQIPTSLSNWGSAALDFLDARSVQKGWRFPVLLVSINPYIYIYLKYPYTSRYISIYFCIFTICVWWPPPRQLPTQSTHPVMHRRWPRPPNKNTRMQCSSACKRKTMKNEWRSVKFSQGICSSEI